MLLTSISESARQRGWAFQRFGDLADVVSDGEHISPEFCRSGIPILSAKDVLNDGVDFSGARHITSEAAERCGEIVAEMQAAEWRPAHC